MPAASRKIFTAIPLHATHFPKIHCKTKTDALYSKHESNECTNERSAEHGRGKGQAVAYALPAVDAGGAAYIS